MSNIPLVITIDGKKYSGITDEIGGYYDSFTTQQTSQNNVTVTFLGDTNYAPTSNSMIVKLSDDELIPTIITVINT